MLTPSTDDLLTRLGRLSLIGDDAGLLASVAKGLGDVGASGRAVALGKAVEAAARTHQWDSALRLVDELLSSGLNLVQEAEVRWFRATFLDRLGLADEAEDERLRCASAAPPDSPIHALLLAHRAARLPDPEAIPVLREAIALAPRSPKLHQLASYSHYKAGQPDLAEVHGVIFVALDPTAADLVSAILARDIRVTFDEAAELLREQSLVMPVAEAEYDAARDRVRALVRQASGPLHVGSSDFRVWREQGYAYVDKSSYISSVLTGSAQAMLFSAPRRFGKSLNLSMLRYFLDGTDARPELFEDLVVWGDPVARGQFARKTVIHVSLKDAGVGREGLERKLANLLQEHVERLADQIDAKRLGSFDRKLMGHYRTRSADVYDLVDGFKRLSTWLWESGRSVWLLIDEYDAPIQKAANTGDEDAVLSLLRDFLSAALKDNPHIERAVLTGVLQVGRESMFSGLNNVVAYPMHRAGSAPWFGFDVYDVLRLARLRGAEHRFDEMRDWYDGYQSGGRDVFNPWSVLNFLNLTGTSEDTAPRAFWGGSGTPTFAQALIEQHEPDVADDLRRLLGGEAIRAEIDDGVSLPDLRSNPRALWTLLLHSGYLTADRGRPGTVKAPNIEALHELRRMVQPVLEKRRVGLARFQAFVSALVAGRAEEVERIIQEILLVNVSSHDVGRNHENPYHTLLLGMLVFVHGDDYQVLSNPERGRGRPDIVLIPKRGGAGVVLELKRASSESEIEGKLEEAVAQIADRQYVAAFPAGCRVNAYAVAAFGKSVRVRLLP